MAMAKRFDRKFAGLAVAAALTAALALTVQPAGAAEPRGHAQLERLIHETLRAGGPLFTAEERAVIERKCGYAPGSWDGFDANISNGVFHCNNGRRLDDAETRQLIAAAAPRIGQRVSAVMARPEIREAIGEVARVAAQEAVREMRERHGR